MPSIPHSFAAALIAYAAPAAAFAIAAGLPLLGRGKAWVGLAVPLAVCAGWTLLQPGPTLPRAFWAPHRGTDALLLPALTCVLGAAFLAWRRGARARLAGIAVAGFAGWWVARDGVGTADFWRVWFAVGVVAWLVSRVVAGQADRLLMVAVALWGGLAVAGAGSGWQAAALVLGTAAAGLWISGAQPVMHAGAVAALLGAADLAGGRALRGHVDAVDAACMLALAAPAIAGLVSPRIGRLSGRLSTLASGAVGAGGVVAVIWLVRRVLLT